MFDSIKDVAEEQAEQRIYEEGGYPALWKYRMVRMMKRCGCL